MRRINDTEVELTEPERILNEWHESLLNTGYGQHEAVEKMLNATSVQSLTWELLNQQDFRDWLTSDTGTVIAVEGELPTAKLTRRHDCTATGEASKNLEFTGTMGAPGVGNCYKCRVCGAPWVKVGDTIYREDEQDGDSEPPWVLSIDDVR